LLVERNNTFRKNIQRRKVEGHRKEKPRQVQFFF
jgi:hypothetical protein